MDKIQKVYTKRTQLLLFLCLRNDNRGDNVRPDPGAAEAGEYYPGETHQGGVDVEVLSNTTADTAQHTIYS